MFSAFPEDFVRYDSARCSIKGDNVLKEFTFPTNIIQNERVALIECEKFCGRMENCWGCSTEEKGLQQWNAITECGDLEQETGSNYGNVSQKPST